MKQLIKDKIIEAAVAAHAAGDLKSDAFPEVILESPRLLAHGDLSTNLAMIMAKAQKMAPRAIAEVLVRFLGDGDGLFEKVDIAGPGFINFYLNPERWAPLLARIHDKGDAYGRTDIGKGKKIQVEFVSANPTGPLHVGHGRGAVVGDTVANLLAHCGYDVQREYYINDSGRQIQTLGRSVYLRLKAQNGMTVAFPDDCYQGAYIRDLAAALPEADKASVLSADEPAGVAACARYAATEILNGIRDDLSAFGVTFDNWFSEQTLYDADKVMTVIDELKQRGIIYDDGGASWFNTSNFGDEKDRVVVRSNGMTTYFASDIAYHQDKYDRGFERVIDVWGADHHGYIPRMKAAIQATGQDADAFDVILVQLVNLLRGGEPVAMSTRSGEFVTLKEVLDEVGTDAARFIFLTRHYESHLDFDLEVARQKTADNPVYYVQYVHARISSILARAVDAGHADAGSHASAAAVRQLTHADDIALVKLLLRYPDVVSFAASVMEPHRITYYLMELAGAFHSYYNKHKVLTDDPVLTEGRLYLMQAIRVVIRNGLSLLGVSAPESM
ncbi:MAG: arginine--tRNA ligase [Deltaproteobacteria bacterium]|nr:MAG: arginine--tRNA ligase [Deltaproteobacteria bacterium]